MAPTSIERQLENHATRLAAAEKRQDQTDRQNAGMADKIDALKTWIMGLLATAVVELCIHGSALFKK